MTNQLTPSTGTVLSCSVKLSWGKVYVVVNIEHDQAKKHSRYRIRSVPLGQVQVL